MLEIKNIIFVILFIFVYAQAEAANHYIFVSASGTGTGASWTNACTAFSGACAPSTRGDTYYVADGSYSSLVISAAVSGVNTINIKKAISSDHGTDTGWNTGTMGSSSATFSGLATSGAGTGYFTIDGNGSVGSTMGISVTFGGAGGRCFDSGSPTTHVTLKYIDCIGPNTTGSPYNFTSSSRDVDLTFFLSGNWTLQTDFTISHCKLHGADTFIQTENTPNLIVEYSELYYNDSSNICCHPNVLYHGSGDNGIFRYNHIHDWAAEGIFMSENNIAGWAVYGNIWENGISTARTFENKNIPITITDFIFYNNTYVNSNVTYSFTGIQSGVVIKNELFYNSNAGVNASGVTHNYNWTSGTTLSEANGIFGGSNPFINLAGGDYNLAFASSPINHGVDLGSPYNTDMNGNTRGSDGTWDMGAYEYCPSGCGGGGGGSSSGRTYGNRTYGNPSSGTRTYGTRTFP